MPRPKAPEGESVCANPLLLSWVGEWLEKAESVNSRGVTMWKKVTDSGLNVKTNGRPTNPSNCVLFTMNIPANSLS